MSTSTVGTCSVATYALRLGDDALILAQRLGEWIANAPQLEEDVALGNIGLDLLGQARLLLTYAGETEGAGRTEDDLAFLRGRARLRQPAGRRATERGLRSHHRAAARCSRPTSSRSTHGWSTPPTRRSPVWPPRPSRRSTTTATTRPSGSSDSATAPTSRRRRMQHGLDADLAVRRRDVHHRRPRAALAADGVAVEVPALRPSGTPTSTRCWPRRRWSDPTPRWTAERRPPRRAHRGVRLPARRDAAPAPLPPRGVVVTASSRRSVRNDQRGYPHATSDTTAEGRARVVAAAVPDPEVPVLTIDDLGVLRDVHGRRATATCR